MNDTNSKITYLVIDGKKFDTEVQLHLILKKELSFPDYYGENLNALWDCLTGWITLPLTIEWKNFKESQKKLGKTTDYILEVFQRAEEQIEGFKIKLS